VDKGEARRIAVARIDELRKMTWEQLRQRYLKRSETHEVSGPSGTVYQVMSEAFWDGAKEGDLRVIVKVDDGGWRAFMPLSEGFILAPDGSFVDE
jgi:hypothetical protein